MALSRREFFVSCGAATASVALAQGAVIDAIAAHFGVASSQEKRRQIMLKDVGKTTLLPWLNAKFQVSDSSGARTELRLQEIADGPSDSRIVQFSLFFLGPSEPLLPQAIYRFEHPETGPIEMFIVPVRKDEKGVRYQAVFSRLIAQA